MRKKTIVLLTLLIVLVIGVVGAYVGIGFHYQTHFYENVTINGRDVSNMTAREAEELIADQAEAYSLTVTTREGNQETVNGADIGYRFVSNGETESLLKEQSILGWLPALLGEGTAHTFQTAVTYDEALLEQAVGRMSCMQEDQTTAPVDARLEQQEDGTYAIVPETEGNQLDGEKVIALLKETVESGGTEVNLDTEDCYRKPSVYAGDSRLKAEEAVRNKYASITVTYQMGGGATEVLDSRTVSSWFSFDEDLLPVLDRDAVAAWIDQLADRYDTIGTWPAFVTSNGERVYPEARTYGWQMDRETETEELYQLLLQGNSAERSPVWLEGAASHEGAGVGDTYVEIDYTNQRMWFYKNGVLLVETPVVTGNVSAGMASPEGIFCIVGKEENATLVGDDYRTPVSYWMPFYGGVGIHDADSWRSAYGGDIYVWGGSHGCINTPTDQAAVIFQNIEVGTPVVCYSSGTNYGYSQIGTSGGESAAAGSDADIVIIDGGGGGQTEEDWADESAVSQEEILMEGDASSGGGDTDEAEFPITIEDEWSDESVYYSEEIIY